MLSSIARRFRGSRTTGGADTSIQFWLEPPSAEVTFLPSASMALNVPILKPLPTVWIWTTPAPNDFQVVAVHGRKTHESIFSRSITCDFRKNPGGLFFGINARQHAFGTPGIDKRGGSWYKIVWPGAPVFCPRQEGDFVATPPAFLVLFWYARENGSNEPFWRHSAADEASRELVTRYSSVECPPWTAAHTRWVTASRFCGVSLCHAGRPTLVMLRCGH